MWNISENDDTSTFIDIKSETAKLRKTNFESGYLKMGLFKLMASTKMILLTKTTLFENESVKLFGHRAQLTVKIYVWC